VSAERKVQLLLAVLALTWLAAWGAKELIS
jgi:hypothetical protein